MKDMIDGKEVKKDMDELYTMQEVCKIFKLSRPTIYRYMTEGNLKALKMPGRGKGGSLRFDKRHLEEFKRKFLYMPAETA